MIFVTNNMVSWFDVLSRVYCPYSAQDRASLIVPVLEKRYQNVCQHILKDPY